MHALSTQTADAPDCASLPVTNQPEKAPLVRCYYLGDYERNGYDDSDFHVVFWDDIAGEVKNVQYASTRYGGGWGWQSELIRDIPADVFGRIRADIYSKALAALTRAEMARVMEPQPESLGHGARVRFLKTSRKGCKTPFTVGEVGECFWQGWYGTFYRNGYNQRTRHNGRLGVRMTDGRTVWCAMESVRLDCEPDLARVEHQAREASQADALRCPGAWWSAVNHLG